MAAAIYNLLYVAVVVAVAVLVVVVIVDVSQGNTERPIEKEKSTTDFSQSSCDIMCQVVSNSA